MDVNNDDRAEWANTAVETFASMARSQDEELATNIGDLLANLMHLCHREGLDFKERLANGYMHYSEECFEEDTEPTFSLD